MEKKVLYNVLSAISKGESGHSQAPDDNYLKSLKEIGMISLGWDNRLTSFGEDTLNWLRNQIEKW